MNNEIAEKFATLKASIDDNVNTIRYLLLQADKLSGLVESLEDSDDKKTELENSIKELYQIINRLIQQTNALFKQYAEFAGTVKVVR